MALSDGGCPCPDNQVRCGVTSFDPGYCTDACCDLSVEGEICLLNFIREEKRVLTQAGIRQSYVMTAFLDHIVQKYLTVDALAPTVKK